MLSYREPLTSGTTRPTWPVAYVANRHIIGYIRAIAT